MKNSYDILKKEKRPETTEEYLLKRVLDLEEELEFIRSTQLTRVLSNEVNESDVKDENEIGITLETILDYIKNGFTDKSGKHHKQGYLTYVDDEWCICDLITDECFILKELL